MTEYRTFHNVDYIMFSTSEFIPRYAHQTSPEFVKPILGNYNMAFRYESGMIVHYHTSKPEMKYHIMLSGQALQFMRNRNISDIDTIKWLQSLKKPKFTRVDIAVTSEVIGDDMHEFTPEVAWSEYQAQNCKTRLQADKPIVDIDKTVETFYVGDRHKRNRLLRIYDKGLDLGETANRMIRFELETREYSAKIADEIAVGHNIAGIIRRYVDYPNNEAWEKIMNCKPLPRHRIDEPQEDSTIATRKLWLIQSVAPAMANLAHDMENGWSDEFWNDFSARVAFEYNKRSE